MSRTTLKDVAASLHLSGAAVSRALRHDPKISVETRKRVREACDRLGYRPDPLLSELASARWSRTKVSGANIIAYVNTAPPADSAFKRLADDMRRQAEKMGYQLDIFERTEFSTSAKLQRALINRGITEVIFGPVYDQTLDIQLDWKKFICIQVLPGVSRLPLHSVVRDHFNVVTLAWRKAVSFGYRRIGITLIDHPFQSMDDIMRSCAVYACQNHLFPHLPALPPFHFTGQDSRAKDFIHWVHTNRLDAVIDFNGLNAYLLPRLNFQVGFACLHLSQSAPYSDISEYAGISDYDRTCAKEAINLLHFCRRSYQWGIPEDRIDHVIEPTWVEGNSMPPKIADAPALP